MKVKHSVKQEILLRVPESKTEEKKVTGLYFFS